MAQKTGKEDADFKVLEALTLCINNCGVIGNPATGNLCQECFKATTTESSSSQTIGVNSFTAERSCRSGTFTSPERLKPLESSRSRDISQDRPESDGSPAKRIVNRCSGCRKRVGLTGFRCRCGELFCSEHRYSDRHDCSYDYKAVGREAIGRENPLVRAAKIVRI